MAETRIVKSIYGIYHNNILYSEDGMEYSCLSHRSVNTEIQAKRGFFNIVWDTDFKCWIVSQYLIID